MQPSSVIEIMGVPESIVPESLGGVWGNASQMKRSMAFHRDKAAG